VYEPQKFSDHSYWEFCRERTAELLQWLGGPPTPGEGLLIKFLLQTEWRMREHDEEAAKCRGRQRAEFLRMATDQQRLWVQAFPRSSSITSGKDLARAVTRS